MPYIGSFCAYEVVDEAEVEPYLMPFTVNALVAVKRGSRAIRTIPRHYSEPHFVNRRKVPDRPTDSSACRYRVLKSTARPKKAT